MALRSSCVLQRAFRPKDKGASWWRRQRVDDVIAKIPAQFECQLQFPSFQSSSPALLLDVRASDELTMSMTRLAAFEFAKSKAEEIAELPACPRASLTTMFGGVPGVKPEFLSESVDYFRKRRAEHLAALSAADVESVDATSSTAYDDRHQHRKRAMEKRLNKERWLFGTLADGMVTQRVRDHPFLEKTYVAPMLSMGKLLRMELQPLTASHFFLANDEGTRWAVFGGEATATETSTRAQETSLLESLHLCFASAVTREHDAVWLTGDAVCNTRTGDAVLILGPPKSGKTSLALHCLAANPEVALVGSGTVFLTADRQALQPTTQVVGLPLSPSVKLGTLLGTAFANPKLSVPDALLSSPEILEALSKNSLSTLWHVLSSTTNVNVQESFGFGRCLPFGARLAGAVFLDWNTDDISNAALVSDPCRVRMDVTDTEACERIVADGLLHTHPLLEWSCYRSADASLRLADALRIASKTTKFCEVGGAVDFAKATRFVTHTLLSCNATQTSSAYSGAQQVRPAVTEL